MSFGNEQLILEIVNDLKAKTRSYQCQIHFHKSLIASRAIRTMNNQSLASFRTECLAFSPLIGCRRSSFPWRCCPPIAPPRTPPLHCPPPPRAARAQTPASKWADVPMSRSFGKAARPAPTLTPRATHTLNPRQSSRAGDC